MFTAPNNWQTSWESRLIIRSASAVDSAAIARIYNHYVTETIVTFEETIVSDGEMERRISDIQNQNLPWLIGEEHGELIGFALAGPFHHRSAYRYSVETTVYLDYRQTAKGFGRTLYKELLDQLRIQKLHIAMGCIALPNDASVKLHEALGFAKTAYLNEIGFKFGRWVDVGYWQLLLQHAELASR